jgi:hypothetical protein
MLISLRSKASLKFHINKVSLGYFYYNVQFLLITVEITWMLCPCNITSFNTTHLPNRLTAPCLQPYYDALYLGE